MAITKFDPTECALPELARWMDDTGTTQVELATFAQVSQAQISRYLAGKVNLPTDRAIKLSLITNIPVEKLLNRKDASQLQKYLVKRSQVTEANSRD